MKMLVTGGAGFIGSNLCEALLEKGHEVVCLDNFSTGRRENLAAFADHSRFRLIAGDIRHLDDCRKGLEGVDVVFHEAALGSVPRSIKDPLTTNEVNVSGFLNMLVTARDARVKRFIYAASSSTYGDHEALPKVEETIGKPLSPYAVTKYVNELYADVFARIYGLDCIGLRYFNVFGRRQNPEGPYAAVIPLFVKKLMTHEPLTINGDGSFSRDFTYIDNVIRMNMLALETVNREALNQVYNTACGERTSLNTLVACLKELLSVYDPSVAGVRVIHGPERSGDIPHSLAGIEKAGNLLGYLPTHTVRQGLEESIAWYWQNL